MAFFSESVSLNTCGTNASATSPASVLYRGAMSNPINELMQASEFIGKRDAAAIRDFSHE